MIYLVIQDYADELPDSAWEDETEAQVRAIHLNEIKKTKDFNVYAVTLNRAPSDE